MPSSAGSFRVSRRYLVLVIFLLIALYVLIPQLGDFQSSWHLLRHPDVSWVALAGLLTALTYLAGAATYYLLAFHRLHYAQLTLVQLAAMFVNRLLPGGVGALGANYLYLRKHQHSKTQAASVVTINNLLGFAGHGLVVAVALLAFSDGRMAPGAGSDSNWLIFAALLLGLGLVLTLGGILFKRQVFFAALRDLHRQLATYRRRPLRLAAALASSMTLTLCNVAALYFCALALGVHLPFTVILLIFTFGVSTGTATPTPGGLGGFEAGLVAGLVAYQVGNAEALAVALLYRFISYWLALVAGAVAFVLVQRRGLLGG